MIALLKGRMRLMEMELCCTTAERSFFKANNFVTCQKLWRGQKIPKRRFLRKFGWRQFSALIKRPSLIFRIFQKSGKKTVRRNDFWVSLSPVNGTLPWFADRKF